MLPAQEPARERTPRLAEFEALRYGMRIHFGLATFVADEPGRKPARSDEYAPQALDVEQWLATARQAGMRYAVLTAKHRSGHALWDSKFTDHDIASSRE